jgi:dethiobiotin synthetase
MHGLVMIGTAAGAAELEAAAAICAAARESGSRAAAFVASAAGPGAKSGLDLLAEASGQPREELAARAYDAPAPPLLAAQLHGTSLERDPLLDAARVAAQDADLLAVATSGGLLAPLTARYSNRDFALELGFPVVLAVAAGPDMLAQTLLSLEGATGAGVAVPAVVIAGWPETPPRVLLEERALVERQAATAVLTLPAEAARSMDALSGAVRHWPVDEWALAAAVPPPVVEEAPGRRVTLEPYEEWEAQPVGDPRTTPRASIMETMLEIVGSEGPMTASRAYSLYNRASGGRKLTSVARAPLSSSVYWLAQERKVVLVRKDDIPWQDDDVVRMPDSPAVRVRELGPRGLEEVPLDEIAELVRRLRSARGVTGAMELKRAVLSTYGLVRLTARADEYLGLAMGLADGTGGDG